MTQFCPYHFHNLSAHGRVKTRTNCSLISNDFSRKASNQAAVNDILEHSILIEQGSNSWIKSSDLAMPRPRGTPNSSRICSTVRCKFCSWLEILGTSIILHWRHLLLIRNLMWQSRPKRSFTRWSFETAIVFSGKAFTGNPHASRSRTCPTDCTHPLPSSEVGNENEITIHPPILFCSSKFEILQPN